MPDKPAADPFGVWRDMVSQWEKNVNSLANQNMASDQFSGSMNQLMKVMLQAQQSLGDGMVKYLAALNLPSRADLISLGEQLGSIESQLSRIAQILERQARAAENAAAQTHAAVETHAAAGTHAAAETHTTGANGAAPAPPARKSPPRTKRPPPPPA